MKRSMVSGKNKSEIGTFGQEFTEQAICIFIGAALPWRVRVGKVKRDIAESIRDILIE